jgi:signal transduction histidine kinase
VHDVNHPGRSYSRVMSRLDRARSRLADHPTAADGLLAVVAVLAAFAPFVIGPDRAVHDLALTASMVPLTLLAGALLVVRRRYTGPVWAATTAVGLVAMLVEHGPSPAYGPAIVGLYTLASRSPLRITVPAAVVTAVSPAVIVGSQNGSSLVDAFVYGLSAWSGLAAALGVAVRSQRAIVVAAQERVRQAEATREEEAQRQVAEERLRIARELHDVVAHHISVINVQAGVAAHLVRSDPDKAVEALAHVREASQVVLRDVPGLLGLLRTVDDELERAPSPRLVDAQELIEAARRSGLDVTWETSGSPAPLAPGVDLTAYRVLQEALTNAARHGSGRALVVLAHDADGCTLEVRNERRSWSSEATARHGVVGMHERVAAVGGELTVGPAGEHEWLVRARLPAQRDTAAVGW